MVLAHFRCFALRFMGMCRIFPIVGCIEGSSVLMLLCCGSMGVIGMSVILDVLSNIPAMVLPNGHDCPDVDCFFGVDRPGEPHHITEMGSLFATNSHNTIPLDGDSIFGDEMKDLEDAGRDATKTSIVNRCNSDQRTDLVAMIRNNDHLMEGNRNSCIDCPQTSLSGTFRILFSTPGINPSESIHARNEYDMAPRWGIAEHLDGTPETESESQAHEWANASDEHASKRTAEAGGTHMRGGEMVHDRSTSAEHNTQPDVLFTDTVIGSKGQYLVGAEIGCEDPVGCNVFHLIGTALLKNAQSLLRSEPIDGTCKGRSVHEYAYRW